MENQVKNQAVKTIDAWLRVLPLLVVAAPMLLWAADQHFQSDDEARQGRGSLRIRAIDDQLYGIDYRIKKGQASDFDQMNKQRLETERRQILDGTRRE